MKLDVNPYIVRASGGVLCLTMALSNDPLWGLVIVTTFGGVLMGTAYSNWRCSRLRGNDAAIVAAARKVSQAFMTPTETCIPQLQELTKILYLAGYGGK